MRHLVHAKITYVRKLNIYLPKKNVPRPSKYSFSVTFDDEVEYFQYWFMVCGIMVWIPTSIMLVSYVIIWFKLRHSLKAFPYLSIQSRVARSRRKIIHMLLILFLLELVCWAPWQFYLVFDYHVWKSKHDGIPREDVRDTLWDTFPLKKCFIFSLSFGIYKLYPF